MDPHPSREDRLEGRTSKQAEIPGAGRTMIEMSEMERRSGERRAGAPLSERQMRCQDCGTVWYSAVAEITATWGRCVRCSGQLHTERRGGERRDGDEAQAA